MTVALIALTPVVAWLGYFGWRMIDRRRYWDADRVRQRRRHPKTAVSSDGVGGGLAGLSGVAGPLSGFTSADGGSCGTGVGNEGGCSGP